MTRPRINPEISLGNILIFVGMLSSVGVWAGTRDEKGATTATAVTSLEARIGVELDRMRTSIDRLSINVQPIDVLSSRQDQSDRRITEHDTRLGGVDTRLGLHAESIATLRAQVAVIGAPSRRTAP